MSAELIAYSSDPSLMRVGLPFAGPSAENAASPLALRPSPKARALAPPDTGGGPMSAAPDKPATLLDAFNHYRLPQPLRQSLLDLVGAESEDDDPEILAHIPTEALEESS